MSTSAAAGCGSPVRLGSLRTWRDRAIAGLMLFCGLRSCEVLTLDVTDVDVGGRWLRVTGKAGKPADLAGPGHRRTDAVLRAAFVRGPDTRRHRCRRRRPLAAGHR